MKQKLPKSLKISAGFSLVELLIVLLIVGVIVLLVGAIPNSIFLIGGSRQESIAKEIAAKKIENIRASGYTAIESADGTSTFTDPRLDSLQNSQAQLVIAPCPSQICTNSERIKQVKVTISWENNAKSKLVEVTTFVADNGLR